MLKSLEEFEMIFDPRLSNEKIINMFVMISFRYIENRHYEIERVKKSLYLFADK